MAEAALQCPVLQIDALLWNNLAYWCDISKCQTEGKMIKVFFFFQSPREVPVICDKQRQAAHEEEVWGPVHSGYHSHVLQVNL